MYIAKGNIVGVVLQDILLYYPLVAEMQLDWA